MFPSSKSGIYVCREQEKKRDKKDTLLSSGISDEYQDLSPKPNIQKGMNVVDVGGLLITTGIDWDNLGIWCLGSVPVHVIWEKTGHGHGEHLWTTFLSGAEPVFEQDLISPPRIQPGCQLASFDPWTLKAEQFEDVRRCLMLPKRNIDVLEYGSKTTSNISWNIIYICYNN